MTEQAKRFRNIIKVCTFYNLSLRGFGSSVYGLWKHKNSKTNDFNKSSIKKVLIEKFRLNYSLSERTAGSAKKMAVKRKHDK